MQYDQVIHNWLDRTKSRTKNKVRNCDRLFLSVLMFLYRGMLNRCYVIIIIIIINIKTLAVLFAFVIML